MAEILNEYTVSDVQYAMRRHHGKIDHTAIEALKQDAARNHGGITRTHLIAAGHPKLLIDPEEDHKHIKEENINETIHPRAKENIERYRELSDPDHEGDEADHEEKKNIEDHAVQHGYSQHLQGVADSHYPRKNHIHGYDSLEHRAKFNTPKVTKFGKLNKQSAGKLKGQIKADLKYSAKTHHLPESRHIKEENMSDTNTLTQRFIDLALSDQASKLGDAFAEALQPKINDALGLRKVEIAGRLFAESKK